MTRGAKVCRPKYETYIEAQDGYQVESTLDLKIQSALETQLEKTYYESNSTNRVTGIVMDVNTGGVLGMATYPSFDLNNPYELSDELLTPFSTYMSDVNQARVRENDNYENFAEMIYNFTQIKENYEAGSDEYQNAYMGASLYSLEK